MRWQIQAVTSARGALRTVTSCKQREGTNGQTKWPHRQRVCSSMRNLAAFVSGQRAGERYRGCSGSSARLACHQWGGLASALEAGHWTVLEGPLGLTARRAAPTARCRSRGPARLCRAPCSAHRAVPGWPLLLASVSSASCLRDALLGVDRTAVAAMEMDEQHQEQIHR